MTPQFSTFDKLVSTLSTKEIQTMLTRIDKGMGSSDEIQTKTAQSALPNNSSAKKDVSIADELLLVQLWIRFLAFIHSTPVEQAYQDELIRRIGRNLHRNYQHYISTKDKLFLTPFYKALRELRKTQLFFSSLLATYDSDKGNFYILVSSFTLPDIYAELMQITDPFTTTEKTEDVQTLKAQLLKSINKHFSLISGEQKADMYQYAQAIEWMKNFCDLPLESTLLRFTTHSPAHTFCPVKFISTDIMDLANLLEDIKPIPNVVLHSLFLLAKQDYLTQTVDLKKEADDFIAEASRTLEIIRQFKKKVPITDCARYAAHSITYEMIPISRGEDWFFLFKNAWKKRFNDRWNVWITEQKKANLNIRMLDLLYPNLITPLRHRPWKDALIVLQFKREFSFCFLRTFFATVYKKSIQSYLKIILLEGNFYRRENLTEYTAAFTALKNQAGDSDIFEVKLSPEGELGAAFAHHKAKKMTNIKNKNSLEALMRSVETEAKQIIKTSQESFKTLITILNGFFEGNKNGIYAPLINWTVIQGDKNTAFRAKLEVIKKQLTAVSVMLSEAEKIELERGS